MDSTPSQNGFHFAAGMDRDGQKLMIWGLLPLANKRSMLPNHSLRTL
jgi:hypothetical protein